MTAVLLLDVDGVLQFPRSGFAATIERDHRWRTGYPAFQKDLFRDPGYLRCLTGEGDFLAVADRILAEHVDGLTAPAFLDRWLSDNIEPNRALLKLIPQLDVEQIHLASNQEARRGAHIAELYRGHGWLDGVFLSYQIGYRKPDTRYFAHILRELGRPPADCLFIDDSADCVAAATGVGIPSIQFVGNRRLAADLAARRLVPPG